MSRPETSKLSSSAFTLALVFVLLFGSVQGCSPFSADPIPGPDKQGEGTLVGAATGAGAGAIIGAQYSAASGPGAWIGAAFGGVFGMLSGLGLDLIEEDEIRREWEQARLREIAWVQEVLSEHYRRRLELHPNRDIFPADLFFEMDNVKLKPSANVLVTELAHLTRRRLPTSRIVVAAFTMSRDAESEYANHLSNRRAEAIANRFIELGMEPRRVLIKGIVTTEPVLLDPDDHPNRYRQAIEILPLDR